MSAIAMICITIAAIAFENPAILWWYILALIIALVEVGL